MKRFAHREKLNTRSSKLVRKSGDYIVSIEMHMISQ